MSEPLDLEPITARAAVDGVYPDVYYNGSWVALAFDDRRALLAEVERLRGEVDLSDATIDDLLATIDSLRGELARQAEQIAAVRTLMERVEGSVQIAQQEGLYLPEAVNLIELRRALDGAS
jgi:hypothetical protein